MRSLLGRWLTGVYLCFAVPSEAHAAEPREPVELARLVERLGSAAYTEREAAEAELARLGPDAKDSLVAALASPDVEVRIRARKLLERVAVEDLWDGTHFEPPPEPQAPLALFETLMKQTGSRLLLHERYAQLPDRPLLLPAGRRTFWPAIDELCGSIDCRFRAHYELLSPGLAIVSGKRGQNPVAYSGPLRAQLTSARRMYQEDFDYATAASERQYTFQLHLELIWEDRFQVVAHRAQPVLVRATTPAGQSVASEQPTGGAWHVVSRGTHQASASLRLHPPSADADRFTELTLAWELIAVGDFATLEITALHDRAAFFQDDVTVRIIEYTTDAAGRVEIELNVGRDLPTPEPQEIAVQELQIELLSEAGEPYGKQGESHVVSLDGVSCKQTFLPPKPGSKPAKLCVKYPRIRSRRALELAFQDVPLPHYQPE